MPVDDRGSSPAREAAEVAPEASKAPLAAKEAAVDPEDAADVRPDDELVKDSSVLNTCGTEDAARDAMDILNKALDRRAMSIKGRDLQDEAFMRVVKAISIFAKLKRLLPTRTAAPPTASQAPSRLSVPRKSGYVRAAV